ncbi:MAG: hypothetical protein C0614_02885 [Desulfuromonas sp.]|nr:MAG: hypothetical protein C0614_02885 [Desulfuromonas sp.]
MTTINSTASPKAPRAISLRIEILLLSLLVLFMAQGFSTLLGTLSFQKSYREIFVSGNRVVAGEFQHKLERAVRFGKKIDNFYGMEALMSSIRDNNPGFLNLEVYLPNGEIAYSLDEKRKGGSTPREWLQQETVEDVEGGPLLLFPVRDFSGNQVATAAVLIDDSPLHAKVWAHFIDQLKLTLMVLAGAATLMIVGLRLLVPLQKGVGFPRRRLLAVVVAATILSQSVFMVLGAFSMRDVFLQVVEEDVSKVTVQLERDLESLLSKGLSLEKLSSVEGMLGKVMEGAPSIAVLRITGPERKAIHQVESHDPIQSAQPWLGRLLVDRQIDIAVPLHQQADGGREVTAGFITSSVSGTFLQQQLQEFWLNSLTVMLVSMLFITEVMLFFLLYVRLKYAAADLRAEGGGGHDYIRSAMSVFLFGFMMSVSFVPLQMQHLLQGVAITVSSEVLSSLPVSAEMFCGLFTVLLSGVWSDRRGWHQPFLVGVAISAVACCWSGTTSDPWQFIASRGLAGCGYGLAWMAAQGFVFGRARAGMRARSLASLAAGVMTGYLSGNVVGAMLADRVGFPPVFLLSAVFILLAFPLVLLFMRSQMQRPEQLARAAETR